MAQVIKVDKEVTVAKEVMEAKEEDNNLDQILKEMHKKKMAKAKNLQDQFQHRKL